MRQLKYYQLVLGCQMNRSDAERLSSLLSTIGFVQTPHVDDANLIAVQACSVRQSAIDRIHARIAKWQKDQKKRLPDNPLVTLLTGCVLTADKEIFKRQFDLVIDTQDLRVRLAEGLIKHFKDYFLPSRTSAASGKANGVLPPLTVADPVHKNAAERGEDKEGFSVTSDDFLGLKPNYSSTFQAYIPIQSGCNNFCSFCAVPYTKGRERYRLHTEIVREVKELVNKGYKEITLLGQNVNTYFDPTLKDAIGKRTRFREWNASTDFPRLLRIVNDIPGDFWIRFVTSNPWDMSDQTIQAVADCEKICEYIHLPIQSGSDRLLKFMNRHHTQKHYLELVDKIRMTIPGVSITTDIIVGFPGETEEDFMETVKVMEYANYDMAYIARYSPRPGTISQKYMADNVPYDEKKRRKKHLEEILKKTALANHTQDIGKVMEVLVDSVSQKRGITKAKGKTRTFKTVSVFADKKKEIPRFGERVSIEIIEAREFGLEGVLAE